MRVNNFLSGEGGGMRSSDGGFNLAGQAEASCSNSAGGEQEVDLLDKDGIMPDLRGFFFCEH